MDVMHCDDAPRALQVALSEDHLNDVQSNLAAILGAAVASNLPKYWWVWLGVQAACSVAALEVGTKQSPPTKR